MLAQLVEASIQEQLYFIMLSPDESVNFGGASRTVMKSNNQHCEGLMVLLFLFQECLQMDPDNRATCSELLGHQYFTCDSFDQR